MLVHYVEFFYPGIILAETEERRIDKRDPKLVTLPDGAFAYRFFDRTEVKENGELLVGSKKNFSTYTFFGKLYTLEEVKEQFPECETLIRNMECNGYTKVVKTRLDNWQPFHDGDIVIES